MLVLSRVGEPRYSLWTYLPELAFGLALSEKVVRKVVLPKGNERRSGASVRQHILSMMVCGAGLHSQIA